MKTMMTKVNKVKLSKQIVENIIEMIKNGDIKPNEKLPSEKQLMVQFGVSRSSLREAMSSLAFLGFVTINAGNGTRVTEITDQMLAQYYSRQTPINIDMIKQIQEARVILEEANIMLATERASKEELNEISYHLECMKDHGNNLDLAVQDDINFHMAIAKASHNSILVDLERQIRQMMAQWITLSLKLPGVYAVVLKHHEEIIKAINSGRSEKARIAMVRHLNLIGEKLTQVTDDIKNK